MIGEKGTVLKVLVSTTMRVTLTVDVIEKDGGVEVCKVCGIDLPSADRVTEALANNGQFAWGQLESMADAIKRRRRWEELKEAGLIK